MKTILISIICLLLSGELFAQHARFISTGTIEYEKSANMNALIKKVYGNMQGSISQAIEQFQKTQPQFKTMKSTLTFNGDKTLYTPIVPETASANTFSTPMSEQINTIYTDLATHITTTQKNVSDANFLIKDTTRKITWKITNETREIAGYPCRRANGLVLDSVYVVAFYTDKIAVSGGPESFSGLPGMILEVAVPHENVTWKAVKITDAEIPAGTMVPPKKGKVMTNKQFYEFLKSMLGNYRDPAQANFAMKSYLL